MVAATVLVVQYYDDGDGGQESSVNAVLTISSLA